MKRILILLVIISASCQLQAQQLTVKPADSLLFKSPKNWGLQQFKLDDSTLFKGLKTLPKLNMLTAIPNLENNSGVFNSRMPVVKVGGDIDRMPIAKLNSDPNMHYPMLIKLVKVVDPLATVKPVTP